MRGSCILDKRRAWSICIRACNRRYKWICIGNIVSPILRVGGCNSKRIFGSGSSNNRQGTISIDDISILWDEHGAVDISEQVHVGQKGKILGNDVEIVECFVCIAGGTIVYVEGLGLR